MIPATLKIFDFLVIKVSLKESESSPMNAFHTFHSVLPKIYIICFEKIINMIPKTIINMDVFELIIFKYVKLTPGIRRGGLFPSPLMPLLVSDFYYYLNLKAINRKTDFESLRLANLSEKDFDLE